MAGGRALLSGPRSWCELLLARRFGIQNEKRNVTLCSQVRKGLADCSIAHLNQNLKSFLDFNPLLSDAIDILQDRSQNMQGEHEQAMSPRICKESLQFICPHRLRLLSCFQCSWLIHQLRLRDIVE